MNGYDNKIVEGEILRVSKDHSAAAYLKVISLQSFSALLAPWAPLSLAKLVYVEWKFASCRPSSLVLLCKLWTLDSNVLTVRTRAWLLTPGLSWFTVWGKLCSSTFIRVTYELRGVAAGPFIHNVREESSAAQRGRGSFKQNCYLLNWL